MAASRRSRIAQRLRVGAPERVLRGGRVQVPRPDHGLIALLLPRRRGRSLAVPLVRGGALWLARLRSLGHASTSAGGKAAVRAKRGHGLTRLRASWFDRGRGTAETRRRPR